MGGADASREGARRNNTPLDDVVVALHSAYTALGGKVPLTEFRHKLLSGVPIWDDLDLPTSLRMLGIRDESDHAEQNEPAAAQSVRRLMDRLSTLTMADALTGLFNRRYFDHRLGQELRRSDREQTPCAVMLVDVDDFAAINERNGRETGDGVLKEVADAMRGSLRASDEVTARFGDEAFGIILPCTGLPDALLVAERLRRRISELELQLAEREAATRTSVSIGVTCAYPTQPKSASELVEQADEALRDAKQAGKNTVKGRGEVPKRNGESRPGL